MSTSLPDGGGPSAVPTGRRSGRSARLTLSYRTTREILNRAMEVVNPRSDQITFDDLDDGTDTLDGYRSVLRGPAPELVRCESWNDALAQLATTLRTWREELATGGADGKVRDPRGNIAVCVADREAVNQVMYYLVTEAELTVAELTKEGVKGDGDIHVGTMHRFKDLEYQRLAIVGARDGVIPHASVVQRYRDTDPRRLAREELKTRSLLFAAATRARDTLPYGTGPHDEIVLVLGELTANAVRHGHVPSRDFHLLLHASAPARAVRIEVTDTRTERTPPEPETLPAPGSEDTGGRGLLLVAALATRWGWHLRPGGQGKTIWAECVFATPT